MEKVLSFIRRVLAALVKCPWAGTADSCESQPLYHGACICGKSKKKDKPAPVEDTQRASATDTLGLQRALSPLEIQAAQQTAPFRGQLLSQYAGQLGQQNNPAATIPVPALLGQAEQGFQDQIGKIPDVPQGLSDTEASVLARGSAAPTDVLELKNKGLQDYDVGYQRYTQDPLMNRMAAMGLASSGGGLEMVRRSADEAARSRSLLGSQYDVQYDALTRQRLQDAMGVGQGQYGRNVYNQQLNTNQLENAYNVGQNQYGRNTGTFDRNQLLGFTQPIQAFQAAGINPGIPTVSPAYESPAPRVNPWAQLGSQVLGSTLQGQGVLSGAGKFFSNGGFNQASATSMAAPMNAASATMDTATAGLPMGFAKGGVAGLRGPEEVEVGEKEPEAIIPLSKIRNLLNNTRHTRG